MPRCLLLDQDTQDRSRLSKYLECFAISVKTANGASELKRLLQQEPFDVIVMDLALEAGGGLELCQWIQSNVPVPLIVLTAQSDPTSRVVGLEFGADDYIDKPCDPRELVARIRALIRRHQKCRAILHPLDASAQVLEFAGRRLECGSRTLHVDGGKKQILPPADFRLLNVFLARPKQVVTRRQLLESMLLRGQSGDMRAVDLAVSRLRQRLQDSPPQASLILTIRGEGYLLDACVRASGVQAAALHASAIDSATPLQLVNV